MRCACNHDSTAAAPSRGAQAHLAANRLRTTTNASVHSHCGTARAARGVRPRSTWRSSQRQEAALQVVRPHDSLHLRERRDHLHARTHAQRTAHTRTRTAHANTHTRTAHSAQRTAHAHAVRRTGQRRQGGGPDLLCDLGRLEHLRVRTSATGRAARQPSRLAAASPRAHAPKSGGPRSTPGGTHQAQGLG